MVSFPVDYDPTGKIQWHSIDNLIAVIMNLYIAKQLLMQRP